MLGVWILVIVVIVPSFSVLSSLYPSGISSDHVYSISVSLSYFGKFSIVADHLFSSLRTTSIPLLNVTVSSSGLFPSWLSASSQTLIILASVASCLFVIVAPSATGSSAINV